LSRSPWFDAIFDPASILVLLSSIVAGSIAAWWLCPVGILLWLFMVIRILRDPSLRLNQAIQSRKDLAVRFQGPFNQIQKTQINVFNTINTATGATTRELDPINSALNKLVEEVYQACKRFTPMENYRITLTNRENLEQELAKVTTQMNDAAEPAAKQEYVEAIASLNERIGKVRDLCDQLDHFDAQLSGINNEINVVLTEVIQAQSLDAKMAKQKVPEIIQRIAQETGQLSIKA
jgi:uncharacterized protein YukE